MRVVKPDAVTRAMLISSTAVEAYALWSSATTYALNSFARLDASINRNYQCIQGPSTNNPPDSSPLFWADKGPTNTWAMLDDKVSTATTATTSLTVVIDTGYINSLALFGLLGTTALIVGNNGAGGPEVYRRTVNLDGTIIADWYQYFFEPSVQLGEFVLTDLPPYSAMRLTITVSGASVAVGHLSIGTFYTLGDAQYGATASITDYSRKDTDALGVTSFTKRAYSKRMSVLLMLPNAQLNKVQRVLADLRATPCAWIGVDDATYAPLLVYGFYRDFSIDVAYPTESLCNLEIEGLT